MDRNRVMDKDVAEFVEKMADVYNQCLGSFLKRDPVAFLPHLEVIHFVGSNIAGNMMSFLTGVTPEEWHRLVGDPAEKFNAALNELGRNRS